MLYISHYACLKNLFILELLPILTNYGDLAMQTDILLGNKQGDNPKPDPHQWKKKK